MSEKGTAGKPDFPFNVDFDLVRIQQADQAGVAHHAREISVELAVSCRPSR